jgi:hypothetical protein
VALRLPLSTKLWAVAIDGAIMWICVAAYITSFNYTAQIPPRPREGRETRLGRKTDLDLANSLQFQSNTSLFAVCPIDVFEQGHFPVNIKSGQLYCYGFERDHCRNPVISEVENMGTFSIQKVEKSISLQELKRHYEKNPFTVISGNVSE